MGDGLFDRNIFFKPLYETTEERKINELKVKIKRLEESLGKADLPERYIINDGATILFWKNGSKTVVKRAEDDEFNPRLAFLTAFFQRYCGMSKNKANKYLASLQIENRSEVKKKTLKYKIGEKVKVRDDLEAYRVCGGDTFMPEMEEFKGKIVTIKSIDMDEYTIEEGGWHWTDEMFEKIAPKHMKEEK